MAETDKFLETYRAQAGVESTGAAATPAADDPFITQIQQQLANQQGIISSSEQDARSLLRGAQESTRAGAEAGRRAIESQYGRLIEEKRTDVSDTLTATRESQRGFATNTALLERIQTTGDKSIRDLEQRKQELILQGQAAAASQISQLQVQEAQMMVQNRQQAFQNLLSMAGLGLQSRGMQLQERQFQQAAFEFDRQMQMNLGNVALQFGVELQPGDTVEDVIAKAAPRANEIRLLQLADLRLGQDLKRAQIALENVKIRNASPSAEDLAGLARGIWLNGADSPFASNAFKTLTEAGNYSAISKVIEELSKPKVQSKLDLNAKIRAISAAGTDYTTAIGKIQTDVTIANKEDAYAIARLIYGKREPQPQEWKRPGPDVPEGQLIDPAIASSIKAMLGR